MGLDDRPVGTRVKLSGLWAATMFCYVYGDYFGLYVGGALADMNRGLIGPLGEATPGVLVGVSTMMAIPSLMVALSLILPARLCRWSCVILGVVYTIIMAITLPGARPFYQLFGAIEIALTLAIVGVALRWPKETSHD